MKPLETEVWVSSECKTEIHAFAGKAQDHYVLGFNPDRIPEADVREFLARYGYVLDR